MAHKTGNRTAGPARLDLREIKHSQSHNIRQIREKVDADGLCTTIQSDVDGLPLRCVGEWGYDKIYRLVKYFGIFANGMSNSWSGLNYVEICSGPGRCIRKNDGFEMDGTALAIVRSPQFHKLKKAIFIDASSRVVGILNKRISSYNASQIAEAVVGDYSDGEGICANLKALQNRCLNLVFIDPTECDVPFDTIRRIVSQLQNTDLLINVAIGTDFNRNSVQAATDNAFNRVREKYERFLGLPGFCARADVVELAKRADYDDLRRKFAETYKEQLNKMGYMYTDVRPVKHFYHLLFASKSERGLDFWLKSCAIAPDNQRELLTEL
jgi:three-Cys-motif partner protein